MKPLNILVIDAQGGGVGKALVEGLKRALPQASVIAVGTNAMATAAMLRAGADAAATGENPVVCQSRTAQVICGPIGIVLADAMLGEIAPAMAVAVAASPAHRVLVPSARCATTVAGVPDVPLQSLIEDAVRAVTRLAAQRGEQF